MATDLKTLTPGTAAASSVVVGATSAAAASPSLFTTTGSGNVVLSASPTLTGNTVVSSGSFGLSGNISSAAWTTSGIRYANVAATLTDTSSTGTVATAYTDVFGGNTIAASNATTFTDYFTMFVSQPTAGTNVTFTNRWALGLSGGLQLKGPNRNNNDQIVIDTQSAAASGNYVGLQIKMGGAARGDLFFYHNTSSLYLFHSTGSGGLVFGTNGSERVYLDHSNSRMNIASNWALSWNNGTNPTSGAADLFLTRAAAATLQLGAADANSTATVSITIAAPGVVTWTGHGLTTGSAVEFTTTGALPTGITAGTTYFAIVVDANTFQIASSEANAFAGTAITTSGSQSGTHTGYKGAISQALKVQSVSAGVSNLGGSPLRIQGSQGTGNAAGGSIIFQVAPAGSSGTAQNALATALTIASDRTLRISGSSNAIIRGTNNYLEFANTGNTAFLFYGSGYAGGDDAFCLDPSASRVQVRSGGAYAWSSQANYSNSTCDLFLYRDAANTLALRNVGNAQQFNVYGSYSSATNYQRCVVKTVREVSSALSGATYVSTAQIPAYAFLIGVTTRVNTAITGATSYSVGDGTTANLWGNNIAVTLDSQSRTADFTAVGAVGATAAARNVTLTANGSNFTGGVVEICLHYLTTEAD